jgi:hypothetical protein
MKIDLAGPNEARPRDGAQRVRGVLRGRCAAPSPRGSSPRSWGLRPAAVSSRHWRSSCSGLAALGVCRARDEAPRRGRGEAATAAPPERGAAVGRERSSGARCLGDRDLSSVTQAGLVNNLNDGMAWGLFPLFFAAAHMSLSQIGTLAAIYPADVGRSGAVRHRRVLRPRRPQVAHRRGHVDTIRGNRRGDGRVDAFAGFATGAALLGVGTAMVYPTLLAAIGDVAHPVVARLRRWACTGSGATSATRSARSSRASRPTRSGLRGGDVGRSGAHLRSSGVIVAVRMRETLKRPG